jgi:hypothetical protein
MCLGKCLDEKFLNMNEKLQWLCHHAPKGFMMFENYSSQNGKVVDDLKEIGRIY